ncbi:uncharacterized protein [Ptychodera flava]|uniref:uncharacterized protein n=1 Tax=Ptychodera flava TaxID=63121 RepID=UPI003969C207
MRGLSNFTAQPRPIYRKDLPEDHVAYWEIEVNSSEYVTISSGSKTGDYRLTQEGPLPSLTTQLDSNAKLVESTCYRYFMLSPDGQMFCEDEKQNIVAISSEGLLDNGIKEKNANRKKFKMGIMIQEQLDELQEEWDHRRLKTEQSAVWSSTTKYRKSKRRRQGQDASEVFHGESYTEQALSPGETTGIPLRDVTSEVTLRVLPFAMNLTDADLSTWQEKLCRVLSDICDKDNPQRVDMTTLDVSESGRQVLLLKMHSNYDFVKDTLEGREIGFQVELNTDNDDIVVRRFGVDLSVAGHSEAERLKRHVARTQYKPWSSWVYSSIKQEDLFPDYWQHKVGKCASGCGPVAWAMVFGYYDRLAHSTTPHGLQRSLWRCDEGGTTGGDDCVAPETLDSDVRLYVEAIREELGTFCLGDQGATPQWSMDLVEGFYCDRQGDTAYISTVKTGGPHGFLGWYSDQVANHIINALEEANLPVVVGYRIGGSVVRQHYAVATKLRRRSRRHRHCFLWWCEDWHTEWDNDIYIHLGGTNGNGNGWRACEAFFSGVAYP